MRKIDSCPHLLGHDCVQQLIANTQRPRHVVIECYRGGYTNFNALLGMVETLI